MSDTAKKLLVFAISLVLTVGFIAVCYSLFSKGQGSVDEQSQKLDGYLGSDTKTSKFIEWESLESVTGATVIQEVKDLLKSDEPYTIVVESAAGTTAMVYKSGNAKTGPFIGSKAAAGYTSDATTKLPNAAQTLTGDSLKYGDSSSAAYINPRLKYTCLTATDGNGFMVITFTAK